MYQWSCIFWRYAPAAATSEQMTWSSLIAHHSTVLRIAEQDRLAYTKGYIPIKYDIAIRQSWARRALQRDPALDIHSECCSVNQEILDTVRAQAASSVIQLLFALRCASVLAHVCAFVAPSQELDCALLGFEWKQTQNMYVRK